MTVCVVPVPTQRLLGLTGRSRAFLPVPQAKDAGAQPAPASRGHVREKRLAQSLANIPAETTTTTAESVMGKPQKKKKKKKKAAGGKDTGTGKGHTAAAKAAGKSKKGGAKSGAKAKAKRQANVQAEVRARSACYVDDTACGAGRLEPVASLGGCVRRRV